jgi:hypothetical protein
MVTGSDLNKAKAEPCAAISPQFGLSGNRVAPPATL